MKIDFFKADDFKPLTGTRMEHASINAAERANEILKERGTVVYDGSAGMGCTTVGTWSTLRHDERNHLAISSNFVNSKRQALLINIQPIEKPDTADGLLKEFFAASNGIPNALGYQMWLDRAKAWLEKQK